MRRAAVATALVCMLVGASVAEAAIRGKYSGSFRDKNGTISLTVSKKKRIVKITRGGFLMKCSDGQSYKRAANTATGNGIIESDGSFDLVGDNEDGSVKFDLEGRFTSDTRVRGFLRETARFNDRDELDPNGSILCKSGTIKFVAKRQ
jgi:hypothetical protein